MSEQDTRYLKTQRHPGKGFINLTPLFDDARLYLSNKYSVSDAVDFVMSDYKFSSEFITARVQDMVTEYAKNEAKKWGSK
jgi:hypothetical protein